MTSTVEAPSLQGQREKLQLLKAQIQKNPPKLRFLQPVLIKASGNPGMVIGYSLDTFYEDEIDDPGEWLYEVVQYSDHELNEEIHYSTSFFRAEELIGD